MYKQVDNALCHCPGNGSAAYWRTVSELQMDFDNLH